jgi:predicted metalloprotease
MKRIAALGLMVASLAVMLGVTVGKADALNPNQTTVAGVVGNVYWDLNTFWGNPSQKPGVDYFNYWRNGQLVNYKTECFYTRDQVGTQGFYCDGGSIYFDYRQQVGNLTNIGDGAVALWIAHEYGHHAQWLRGIKWRSSPPYEELLADCFAGLYFRYGVYTSGTLVYHDYLEARTMLSRLSSSRSHGTPAQRVRAFDYGFNRIGWRSCTSGWQAW